MAEPTLHLSASGSLDQDHDGWIYPRCSCGWKFGPVPDAQTACDALMAHAWDQGFSAAAAVAREALA